MGFFGSVDFPGCPEWHVSTGDIVRNPSEKLPFCPGLADEFEALPTGTRFRKSGGWICWSGSRSSILRLPDQYSESRSNGREGEITFPDCDAAPIVTPMSQHLKSRGNLVQGPLRIRQILEWQMFHAHLPCNPSECSWCCHLSQ